MKLAGLPEDKYKCNTELKRPATISGGGDSAWESVRTGLFYLQAGAELYNTCKP